ncbi:MAG: amidophosphoribosyltransferase [Ruminococcaceae bacterium]|nr:amidophosphoribosyltransferase [Oscillospiraceae bacterium]
MGGYFGVAARGDALVDAFFGTDYHSHLGTARAGLAVYDKEIGLQREIHNIKNSPFRTKFEHVFEEMRGTSAIGCISDGEPQPLLIRSHHGTYAICNIGAVTNADALIEKYFKTSGGHFDAMTGGAVNPTELVAALIDQKSDFVEGIRFAQSEIEGSITVLILREGGSIIAARDKLGRLPVILGKGEDAYCVSFESFAAEKLGYTVFRELGPGEIVEITHEGSRQLVAPGKEMKICSFLWSYYGYSPSSYEGVNVECMRYRNGAIMAEAEQKAGTLPQVDSVAGMPDSGTPHAIGFANQSAIPFARPFLKYTPTWSRSFTAGKQVDRSRVAKMKQVPVRELIDGKDLLFVDDSIVRGTQLKSTVDFLFNSGAKSVHMRSACPPIMYRCKYLKFTNAKNDMELLARRVILELEGEEGEKHIEEYIDGNTERGKNLRRVICERMHFNSLEFQSLEGVIKAIGLEPCKLCTYCWNGKE